MNYASSNEYYVMVKYVRVMIEYENLYVWYRELVSWGSSIPLFNKSSFYILINVFAWIKSES